MLSMMMGITGVCSRIIGEVAQVLRVSRSANSSHPAISADDSSTCKAESSKVPGADDDLMVKALTAVFGMKDNGKIKKEKARRVVEKLGLIIYNDQSDQNVEDEVGVEEVLGRVEDELTKRDELLREAFEIFDEDGNGYIEATELKRVLECLGLDKGWDMGEIEKMLKVVDLNLDGKVDFAEFQSMMMMG